MLTEEIPLVRILFLFFFEPYFNTSMEKEERYCRLCYINIPFYVNGKIP